MDDERPGPDENPIRGATSPERQFIEDIAKPAVIETATDVVGLGDDAFTI